MTVEYPMWLPVVGVPLALVAAVVFLGVSHVRDGRRIARTQWISAHLPLVRRQTGVADAALQDLTGVRR